MIMDFKEGEIKGLIIKFLRKEIDEETFLRLKRKLE